MKRLTLFLATALLLATAGSMHATLLPEAIEPIAGTYSGLMPCADCEAITTTITLTDPLLARGIQAGAFTMDMVYKGRTAHLHTTGRWDFIPPQENEHGPRDSGVVRLIPATTPASPQFFWCERGQALRLLDGNLQELPQLMPHTLLRVAPARAKK